MHCKYTYIHEYAAFCNSVTFIHSHDSLGDRYFRSKYRNVYVQCHVNLLMFCASGLGMDVGWYSSAVMLGTMYSTVGVYVDLYGDC